MKRLTALGALLLAGCVNLGNLGESPAITYYVLEDSAAVERAPAPDPRTLLLLDTQTAAFYDTTNLAFARTPATRGQYQFAHWTERPGKRITELLRTRLAAWGGFAGVAVAGGPIRGDLLLDTRLVEFYHDVATPPGSVRVTLDAELVDLATRSLVARKRFEHRAAVADASAEGAAAGFDRATAAVLDELVAWLAAQRK